MSLRPSEAILLPVSTASAESFSSSSAPPDMPLRQPTSQARPAWIGPLTLQLDVLSNPVGHLLIQSLVHRHFPPHLAPGTLVKLVHRRRNRPRLVGGHAAHGKEAVENLAVVELDGEVFNAQCVERLDEDEEDLGVGHHGVVHAGDVKVLPRKRCESRGGAGQSTGMARQRAIPQLFPPLRFPRAHGRLAPLRQRIGMCHSHTDRTP
jgi:hypothetical protein